MPKKLTPDLFVVDGSNIATEGRSNPSLSQLNEAVLSFMDQEPEATITVVVDATFGHRIDKSEVEAFDEAVANNELVTPPAGAIGRGDAFVLMIAHKAKAGILSNDSFQEFHGDYEWLFDEGRLVGGKPVPHVGWVFVARSPVRGPKSRRAVRESQEPKTAAKERANSRVRAKSVGVPADEPVSIQDEADDGDIAEQSSRGRGGRSRRRGGGGQSSESRTAVPDATVASDITSAAGSAPTARDHVNELMPFLEFAERHPTGTSCTGLVESYASHGAYIRVDDVLVYIPMRLMDDPAPRSARSVMAIGEAVTAVIVGYVPDRRSIDAALPNMADGAMADAAATASTADEASADAEPVARTRTSARRSGSKRSVVDQSVDAPESDAPPAPAAAQPAPARRTPGRRGPRRLQPDADVATTSGDERADTTADADVAPTVGASSRSRRSASGGRRDVTVAQGDVSGDASAPTEVTAPVSAGPVSARKRPARSSATDTTPARTRTSPAKKTAVKTAAAATTKTATSQEAPARKPAAKKAPAKAGAKQAAAKRDTTKQAPAKAAAKKVPAQQAPAKRAPAKSAAKKVSAKKVPAKQAPVKKAAGRQAPAKQASATKAAAKQPAANKAPAKKAPAKKAPAKAARKKAPAKRTSA